jgi:hypothetical protein
MKIFGILLIFFTVIYASKLSIGFASINPARSIDSTIREINDGIVKERHLNIKVKFLNFKGKHIKNNDDKEDISEVLDEFSVSLYDALHRSGPSLSTKEQQEARFSDVQYKEVALTPKNIKKVWVFHENRKKYGIKFLSSLAKKQKLDIIIFQKIAKRKWTSFGANLNGDGRIKPTIAVFNNFSKAHTFSYPKILAKYFINEEYEKISSIIEEKSIDALKKAFSVGVADSFLDNEPIKKEIKKTSTKKPKKIQKKSKKIQVNDLSDMGGTGGF